MSHPPISLGTPNAISSLEADFGALPSDKPAGPTTALVLPEVAPVLPSPQQVKELGLQTLVTSGLSGSGSSASAALQSFLENKSQQRLAMAGSTLFQENWKQKTTPLGRSYLEHTARARRTSASDYTSVPTPNTPSSGPNSKSTATHTGGMDLDGVATLSTVPTPQAHDVTGRSDHQKEIHGTKHGCSCLVQTANLSSVATPRTEDSQCAGAHRGTPDTLHSQANLASISTPSSRDWKGTSEMSETGVDPDGSTRTRLDQLPRQGQLAASGPTVTGGTGATKSIGQLDPAYSRWLMAAPPEWDDFACTAMQSVSARRKRSSKRT